MKRWVIIVVVFLLAGAVVNVAVAWGCAYGGTKYETHRIEVLRTPETLYAVHVLTAFGRELLMLFPLEEETLPVFKGMGIEIDPVDEGRSDWSVIRQSGGRVLRLGLSTRRRRAGRRSASDTKRAQQASYTVARSSADRDATTHPPACHLRFQGAIARCL